MNAWQFSLRSLLVVLMIGGLVVALVITQQRLRDAQAEVKQLRNEVGYLPPSDAEDQISAIRVLMAEPLCWRARVRIPENEKYRLAYSTIWRPSAAHPQWFAAQALPEGESIITLRVLKDQRDNYWKVMCLVDRNQGRSQIATRLPEEIERVFRKSNSTFSHSIERTAQTFDVGKSFRLFDERFLGDGGMLLFGDRPPDEEVIGVFADVQPDIGTLN